MQSYAGFWRRVGAFGLDYVIILGYLIVLTGVTFIARRFLPEVLGRMGADPLSAQFSGFMVLTLPISLYFALSEASAHQATWGKHRMGLRVIRTDGSPLSLGRSLLRTALKFLPWEISHWCLWQLSFAVGEPSPLIISGYILVWGLVVLYAAALILSKTHQTLYDRLVNSAVILSSHRTT